MHVSDSPNYHCSCTTTIISTAGTGDNTICSPCCVSAAAARSLASIEKLDEELPLKKRWARHGIQPTAKALRERMRREHGRV